MLSANLSPHWLARHGRVCVPMFRLGRPFNSCPTSCSLWLLSLLPPPPRSSLWVTALLLLQVRVLCQMVVVHLAHNLITAFAAAHKHPSILDLGNAMLGRVPRDRYTYMTMRQRLDFALIVLIFGIVVGMWVTEFNVDGRSADGYLFQYQRIWCPHGTTAGMFHITCDCRASS